MTQESKSFFQKYWQAILIAISINVIINLFTNLGAYKVILYRIDENEQKNKVQDQSVFELQQNFIYIAAKENYDLPHNFTMSRGN